MWWQQTLKNRRWFGSPQSKRLPSNGIQKECTAIPLPHSWFTEPIMNTPVKSLLTNKTQEECIAFLIAQNTITKIEMELAPYHIDYGQKTTLYRICQCCGVAEIDTLRYEDMPLGVEQRHNATWNENSLIVIGSRAIEAPMPELPNGKHYLNLIGEDKGTPFNFLITWNDV